MKLIRRVRFTQQNFFEGVLWLEEEVSSERTRNVALLDIAVVNLCTLPTILRKHARFSNVSSLGFPIFPPVMTMSDDSLGQRTKIPPNLRDSGETAIVARGKPRARHIPLGKVFQL